MKAAELVLGPCLGARSLQGKEVSTAQYSQRMF